MKVKVHMTAFGKPGEIREVELTDFRGTPGVGNIQFLDEVFTLGQNDFQPQDHPSVSVGDVIQDGDKLFLIGPVGFRPLTQGQFDEYVTTPRRDRVFLAFS